MENIANKLKEYKEVLEQMPTKADAQKVSREKFTLLLSGISACRQVPGILGHMGYDTLYHCVSEKHKEMVREHLRDLRGIVDKDSLFQMCFDEYSMGNEYEQFMTFWKDAPLFDVEKLNEAGKAEFTKCKAVAETFYPMLEEKGICAWDISERIGLCRIAVACDIITEEEFWENTTKWVDRAQVFYHSFQEYAFGCLCGAVYYMSKYDSQVEKFLEINWNVVQALFEENAAWAKNAWYVPEKREWAHLLNENPGCIVTKKVLETEKIGYIVKEEPLENRPDSGWRIFTGDESQEYLDDMENITVVGLNSICNLDITVMAYLHAKPGRKFRKKENVWVEEK